MKKPDMSRFKDLFFAHGEKIALGVCLFIALTFGAMSLLKATTVSRADNSQKTWEQELRDHHDRIHREINGSSLADLPEPTKKMFSPGHYEWANLEWNFKPGPYLAIPDSGNSTKRVNPVPLSIRTGPKDIQIDYIRALALTYDIDARTGFWKGFSAGNVVAPVGKPNPKEAVLVPVTDPVRLGVPVRMVRVTAAFPMKQQIEEFRKALRIATQKEMLDKGEDLPNILGLNVVRYQLNDKGEAIGKEVEIIKLSQRSKALDDLMRVAIYDRVQPEVMKKYLYNGLFTPLPTLANAKYPKVELDGFDLEYPPEADPVRLVEQPKEGMKPPEKKIMLPGGGKRPPFPMPEQPMMNPVAGPDRKIVDYRRADLKKADEPLERRLFGEPGADISNRHRASDYNITHALGLFPPQIPDGKGGAFPGQFPGGGPAADNLYFSAWKIEPPMPGVGADGGMKPVVGVGQPGQQHPDWDRDALVSFIDPDVVPGETYSYKIQVRIANPNFKFQKIDELAYAALANQPELVIGNSHPKWEFTPAVTIPLEYNLYAADQQLIDEWAGPGPKKGPVTLDPKVRETTAFQIHVWAKRERDFFKGQDHDIGDMIIAERILVRRGDPIGVNAYVKIASWNRTKNSLDIPSFKEPFPKDKKNPATIYGAFLNMLATVAVVEEGVRKEGKLPPPVLVDFYGGKRTRPGSNVVDEETAVDCLIMTPDGQLFVRNSRLDTDPATPQGREREERVSENRRHFNDLVRSLIGAPAGMPGGPVLPGVKN